MHRVTKFLSVVLMTCLMVGTLPAWAGTSIGIVINKPTNQLGYYQNGKLTTQFPVATGRDPSLTPEGEFKVVRKLVNPYYNKKNIPGGSPRNPLGVRWLGLGVGNTGGGTYGIHGTNNPDSIGTYASSGCIRMYNKDVIWLYDHTPYNTHVKIGNWKTLPSTPVFEETIPLQVNNTTIKGSNKVYMRNGSAWIILKDTAINLGYKLGWDPINRVVILRKPQRELLVSPDRDITKLNQRNYSTPVIIRNNQAYVNPTFVQDFLIAKVTVTETKVTVQNK